ncbi:MAG: polysaccharide export protein, partial [Rhizobiaceae bacterium]
NVLQAIALSGGLGPFAAKKRIQIRRRIRGEDVYYSFNYRAVEKGDELDDNIYLRDGDVIVVPERRLFE